MIKEILEKYINYYSYNRGIGHSSAAINGVKESDAYLITHTNKLKFPNAKTLIFDDFNKLIGQNCPIVFDNGAIQIIFQKAVSEIERLENEILIRDKELNRIYQIATAF